MKQIRGFIVLFLSVSLVFVSCTEDNDDDINFQDEYTGIWDIQETEGLNAPQTYQVEIRNGISETDIVINGLYQSGTTVNATISGFDLSIPQQESDEISFSGSGRANADFEQITLEFTANDGTGDDNIKAILVK